MDTELKKLDNIRATCNGILRQYAEIPQHRIPQLAKDMISYARAVANLCDSIEAGHRDSSKPAAYHELDSLMSSMMDIKGRMDRRTAMNEKNEEEPTNPQNPKPSQHPPALEGPARDLEAGLTRIMQAVESLKVDDEKKIGILIGITLGYCKRAKKDLVQVVTEHQDAVAKAGVVLK